MDYNVTYRKKDKGIQCIISYKDNDGIWRQKSKQGFKTQKESKPWIDSMVEELEKTIKVADEFRGMTFGEFKEMFLRDKNRESAHNTMLGTETALSKFKSLNDVPISDVGYIHIKPCVDDLIDKGMKNTTIELYLTKLKSVFYHAIENYEIISVNPVKNKQYQLPQIKEKDKIRVLKKSELDDLFSNLKGSDYYMSLIAVKCGLRIGEIVGLTDIDVMDSEIKIDKQWKLLDDKKYGFGPPKSKNSYRTVPIPKDYISVIKQYVDNCVLGIDRRIFLVSRTSSVSNRLKRKYNNLGYDISVHDLRHTYVTTLLSNGLPYRTVAELIGDTEETVIKTYSHFTEDMYVSAKSKIDNIL